jgi:hypothetical protein
LGIEQTASAFRYRAFISYSHADKQLARRIQRALEGYQVPIDVKIDCLSKARKLGRIFRDDEDLAASGTLSVAIRTAIEDAQNLIVVCSPKSTSSKWVNQEIGFFRSLRGSDRIFAVVVDGQPHAADPNEECFPAALTEADGSEPLATDLRLDGISRAVTRLAAGMLDLPFDELWKRTERAARQRRRRRLAVQSGVIVTVGALLLVLYLIDKNQIVNKIGVSQNYIAEIISGPSAVLRKPNSIERMLINTSINASQSYVSLDYNNVIKQREAEAGWTMAQELIALHGRDRQADANALALINATHLTGTSCWPEYVKDADCHTLATSWALYSQALFAPQTDQSSLNALLDAQSPEGWWPMYFSLRGDRSNASTYATAWAIIAIGAQANVATPVMQRRISVARANAIQWILSSEDQARHRWKDYPYNKGGVALDGVSALAVVALNQLPKDPRVMAVNRTWLVDLPIYPGTLDEIERSNIELLGRSFRWDRTSYVVTPWTALSVDLAMRDGTTLGRANGRTYLDRFIAGLKTLKPASDPNYFSAELVACLTKISHGP